MDDKKYTQGDNIDINRYTKKESYITKANDLDEKTNPNSLEGLTISKDETIDIEEPISNDNNDFIRNRSKEEKIRMQYNSKIVDISSKGIFVWFYKLTKNKTRNRMIIGSALILLSIMHIDRLIEAKNLENNSLQRKIERLEKMSIFQSNELLKYMQEEELQKNINSKNLNLKRLDTAPYIIKDKKDNQNY